MKNTTDKDLILPYRLGVGIMIINDLNQVFVGKRIDTRSDAWQMPQGGIDENETPQQAAMREMLEETGCDKAEIIAESKGWFYYDLPEALIPKLWNGKYRGQQQKWFLFRFKGQDSDFNLATAQPEFNEWRWVALNELSSIIVPFKRKLYMSVVEEFRKFILSK